MGKLHQDHLGRLFGAVAEVNMFVGGPRDQPKEKINKWVRAVGSPGVSHPGAALGSQLEAIAGTGWEETRR